MTTLIIAALLLLGLTTLPAQAAESEFGPQNPFYAPSTLPFEAPPFNKIKDSDYQPAIEAGMAQQKKEMEDIANNPAPPTAMPVAPAIGFSDRLSFYTARALHVLRNRQNQDPRFSSHQQTDGNDDLRSHNASLSAVSEWAI